MTFWKRQNYAERRRLWVPGVMQVEDRVDSADHRGFSNRETAPCDTVVLDTCPHTFVQTHGMYPQPECTLLGKCGLWVHRL